MSDRSRPALVGVATYEPRDGDHAHGDPRHSGYALGARRDCEVRCEGPALFGGGGHPGVEVFGDAVHEDHDGGTVWFAPDGWAYLEALVRHSFHPFCPACLDYARANERQRFYPELAPYGDA